MSASGACLEASVRHVFFPVQATDLPDSPSAKVIAERHGAWKGDLPNGEPAWTIVQDHINPNLLFVGTEYGLSFSVDGGDHWIKIRNGMPPVPIRDLEIQKRESDLAVASFGRGFFILDDYSPLRQLTPQVLQSEGVLFAPGRKARLYSELGYYRAQGDSALFGRSVQPHLSLHLSGAGVPRRPRALRRRDPRPR